MRQWFDVKVMQQVSWHLRKERGAGHLDKNTGDVTSTNLSPFHSLAGSETEFLTSLQVSKSMRAYVWKPECWLINWCWAINYWEIQMFTVCWWEHYSLLAKPNVIIKMLPGSMNSEQDKVTGVLSLWYLVRPSSPGIYPQVLMFTGYGSVSFEQRWSHADRFYLSGFFS